MIFWLVVFAVLFAAAVWPLPDEGTQFWWDKDSR